MNITIEINNNYGNVVFYPVCEKAIAFSRLAGTKTLTREALGIIENLGYGIEIKPNHMNTYPGFGSL